MITSNILERTFFIKFGGATGTAFSIDREGRRYIVTARHVLDGIKDGEIVQFFKGGRWQPMRINVVGLGDALKLEEDVAVLAPIDPRIFGANHELPAGGDHKVDFGQRVHFF